MICYVIAAPALLYKALALFHQHLYGGAVLRLFMAVLFVWYMVEITMIGQGIDTRDYRIIGTPMIIVIATVSLSQAINVWKTRHGKGRQEGGG